jgi:hypothetical protein
MGKGVLGGGVLFFEGLRLLQTRITKDQGIFSQSHRLAKIGQKYRGKMSQPVEQIITVNQNVKQ